MQLFKKEKSLIKWPLRKRKYTVWDESLDSIYKWMYNSPKKSEQKDNPTHSCFLLSAFLQVFFCLINFLYQASVKFPFTFLNLSPCEK